MGLLDGIENVGPGNPTANYLKGGRTLLKLTSVRYLEAGASNPNTAFKFSGRVLHSTNEKNVKGETRTGNLGFRFADSARPNMVRMLMAMLSCKEGRAVPASEITKAKVLEVTGEAQPLVGVIVAVDASETFKDSRKSAKNTDGAFTKYEVVVPDDKDLAILAELGEI